MGLIVRLAWRNLRKRPGQVVLLLLVMCLSTTTLSLGWRSTRPAATRGTGFTTASTGSTSRPARRTSRASN